MAVYRPQLNKKRPRKKARLIALLILILLLGAGVFFFFTTTWFAIQSVIILNHEETQYAQYFTNFLVNKNLALFYLNKNQFLQQALQQFPEIKTVEFSNPFIHSGALAVRIKYTLRTEAGALCSSIDTCLFFDDSGYLFKKTSPELAQAYTILIDPASHLEIASSVPRSFFDDFHTITNTLKKLSLIPKTIKATQSNDYHISTSARNGIIIITQSNPLANLNNLAPFLQKKLSTQPQYLETVEYIDARYSEKIFEKKK